MQGYEEQWRVPLWWWPAGAGLAVLAGAWLHGGAGGWRSVVPYAAFLTVAGVLLVAASRGRVRLRDGVLSVPGGRIPLAALGAVRALDVEQTRRVRGPTADIRAFVATRPWLTRAVQVQVEDPEDDTPYWLVGSRRPQRLAEAIEAARGQRR